MKKILTLCLVFLAFALQAQEKPSTKLSRDSILVGDQVKWSIRLTIGEGEDFFFEEPSDPVTEGVETISPFSVDTLKVRRGRMEVEGSMVITSFDSGSFFMPPLVAMVQHKDGSVDTLYYESPTLEVTTIPIDTATFKVYDIKGQMKYPVTFVEVAPWVGGLVLLAAIIWFVVRLIRNRRQDRDFFGKPKVKEPAHIVALRSLEKIRGMKLWQNNRQKQFYSDVTDTLRQYIADNYGISAMEQTSAQMLASLKQTDVESAQYEKIKELFTTADFVKFAKHTASDAENEEVIPTAVSFVNATYMQKMASEDEARQKKEE